jgi:glycerophosphoryl diester phosphodiesterase
MGNASIQLFLEKPIAHRGLHGFGRPENSLAAIKPALETKTPIEIDIGLSKDNKWMLGHWPLYRNLSGELKVFQKSTAYEIQRAWPKTSKRHIPSLSEAMEMIQGKIPLLLDVKLYGLKNPKGLNRLKALIKAYQEKYKGSVAVQSFNPTVLAYFNEKKLEIPRGLVVGSLGNIPSRIIPTGKLPSRVALHYTKPDFLTINSVNPKPYFEFLRKSANVPLLAYNVKSKETLDRVSPLVDNVISDSYLTSQPTPPLICKIINAI